MRYDIMFTVKSPTNGRKITVMDFQKSRMITFLVEEITGDEMEEDLKEFVCGQLEKVNTGYWDYSKK